MKEPTVELRGSSLGDAFGIAWFLRDVDGVRTVGHGGSTNGQFAELLIVPERDFAVVSLSNAGPARHPVQPGRRALGAGALPGRGRAGPGADPTRRRVGP